MSHAKLYSVYLISKIQQFNTQHSIPQHSNYALIIGIIFFQAHSKTVATIDYLLEGLDMNEPL